MGNPTGKGGFKKGQSGNPGGLTKEAREFREIMNAALEGEDMFSAWREGYRKALVDGNGLILVDYANRKMGKPPETFNVEHSGSVENPAKPLTTEELVAIARATKT